MSGVELDGLFPGMNGMQQPPTIVIPLAGIPLGVQQTPQGAQMVVGPVLCQFLIPVNSQGARDVADALRAAATGLVVPTPSVDPSVEPTPE